jgi:hypothetical protein
MVVKEMKMHVAAPESCFQASTADQCYDAIRNWMPSASLCWKFSFRALFETLCIDDLTVRMQQAVAALGPLNLFTIISGLYLFTAAVQSRSTDIPRYSLFGIPISEFLQRRAPAPTDPHCAAKLQAYLAPS